MEEQSRSDVATLVLPDRVPAVSPYVVRVEEDLEERYIYEARMIESMKARKLFAEDDF